jgi:hypothetical protein
LWFDGIGRTTDSGIVAARHGEVVSTALSGMDEDEVDGESMAAVMLGKSNSW